MIVAGGGGGTDMISPVCISANTKITRLNLFHTARLVMSDVDIIQHQFKQNNVTVFAFMMFIFHFASQRDAAFAVFI